MQVFRGKNVMCIGTQMSATSNRANSTSTHISVTFWPVQIGVNFHISIHFFIIIAIVSVGMPYFFNIFHSIYLFTESKALAMSTNSTYVSWLAACKFCKVILSVKVMCR